MEHIDLQNISTYPVIQIKYRCTRVAVIHNRYLSWDINEDSFQLDILWALFISTLSA